MRYGKTVTSEFLKELNTVLSQVGYEFDYRVNHERPYEIELGIRSPIRMDIFRVTIDIRDIFHHKSPRELAAEIFYRTMAKFDHYNEGVRSTNVMYTNMYKKTTKEIVKTEITPEISKVVFNPPATIVFWKDNTKTIVKTQNGEKFDPEKGLAMAISKKYFGNKGNYFNQIKEWTEEYQPSVPNAEFEKKEVYASSIFTSPEFTKAVENINKAAKIAFGIPVEKSAADE